MRSTSRAIVSGVAVTALLVAMLLAAAGAGLFAWQPSYRRLFAHGGDSGRQAADLAPDKPAEICPVARRLLSVSENEWQGVLARIQPLAPPETSSSFCLHWLRLHGAEARLPGHEGLPGKGPPGHETDDDRIKILRLLCDSDAGQSFFGSPTLERTRHGVRFPTALRFPLNKDPAQESHRDQCLAALAELGLPLSWPLRLGRETFTLRDVLSDSIAEFHLGQAEISWTTVAYALYLPPEREWRNRYDERTTFDDLLGELLGRPLERASCGGTHLFQALAVLARADAARPVLGDDARHQLWERLRTLVDLAVRGQEPDGSWRSDWHALLGTDSVRRPTDADPSAAISRLVATGHLAEFLLYLPSELRPPDDCPRRAGLWLQAQLRAASAEVLKRDFCPYTHAVCALKQLMFVESKPSELPIMGIGKR